MSDTSPNVARHLFIRGRVQGVGYRAWTADEAIVRGVEGFVRNRRDGAVEVLLIGAAEVVSEMVAACRQGPRGARVETVDEQAAGPEALALQRPGERFSLLPTR
jgi:acylphosphatase